MKGKECDNCHAQLKEKDYKEKGRWDYKCPKCGYEYNHEKEGRK